MSSNVRFEIHATPNARRTHVGGTHDGALRVAVTTPADKGRANKAIVKLLADAFGTSASQIRLVRGQSNRRKVIEIQDADPSTEARLKELLDA